MVDQLGLDNLAAAIGEERDTIEDVLEPYLIQQGFLQRTPRGRIATSLTYRHFGLQKRRIRDRKKDILISICPFFLKPT